MNSHRYFGILQEKLARHLEIHQCDTFMHDKAKTVTDWLQPNGFSVMDWPGNSPEFVAYSETKSVSTKT